MRSNQAGAVALDPGDYGGTYRLIGGSMSLDFVNTVSYPGADRPHDWLDRPLNVITWALAAGAVDQATARRLKPGIRTDAAKTALALARIRRDRNVLGHVLSPLALGTVPAPAEVDRFNRLLVSTLRHRKVDPNTLEWTWEHASRLEDITRPVILDAANVLTNSDHSRIGHCPACDWLYFDETRNRNRRWCHMADCGSRDKARRYYYRRTRTTI